MTACDGGILYNSCGGGTCVPDPDDLTKYTCFCPSGYINVKNEDGNEGCTLIDVCGANTYNPCGIGMCMNDNKGKYTCDCTTFPGFAPYVRTIDGSATCEPVEESSFSVENSTFIVPEGGLTCAKIAEINLLDRINFLYLNPNLEPFCGKVPNGLLIAEGTNVAIGPVARKGITCGVIYTTQASDTCNSLVEQFTTPPKFLTLSTLTSINPSNGLDCTHPNDSLPPDLQICVEKSSIFLDQPCGAFYQIKSTDRERDCEFLYKGRTSALEFFSLNPGLHCDNLIPGELVCVLPYDPQLFESKGCPANSCTAKNIKKKVTKIVAIKRGWSCLTILTSTPTFKCSLGLFKCLNGGASCVDRKLTVNKRVCAPGSKNKNKSKCSKTLTAVSV